MASNASCTSVIAPIARSIAFVTDGRARSTADASPCPRAGEIGPTLREARRAALRSAPRPAPRARRRPLRSPRSVAAPPRPPVDRQRRPRRPPSTSTLRPPTLLASSTPAISGAPGRSRSFRRIVHPDAMPDDRRAARGTRAPTHRRCGGSGTARSIGGRSGAGSSVASASATIGARPSSSASARADPTSRAPRFRGRPSATAGGSARTPRLRPRRPLAACRCGSRARARPRSGGAAAASLPMSAASPAMWCETDPSTNAGGRRRCRA